MDHTIGSFQELNAGLDGIRDNNDGNKVTEKNSLSLITRFIADDDEVVI